MDRVNDQHPVEVDVDRGPDGYSSYKSKTDVLNHGDIDDIAQFTFTVEYQPYGALPLPAAKQILVSGYSILNEVLERSGIHSPDELKGMLSGVEPEAADNVQFILGGVEYACEIVVSGSHMAISRSASSFEAFHNWYIKFMPHAQKLAAAFQQIIRSATGHTMTPTSIRHTFMLILTHFARAKGGERIRNTEALESIGLMIPNDDEKGNLQPIGTQQLYRVDISISRMLELAGKRREAWLKLEAPFNEGGKHVVLTAQMRNATIHVLRDSSITEVLPIDPDSAGDFRIAIEDFLRDFVFNKFLKNSFPGVTYESRRDL